MRLRYHTFIALFLAVSILPINYVFPDGEKFLRVCDDVTDPLSLDPYQVFSEKTHTIIQQIMEGLLRFNSEGHFEPALAERWERINDTTMRFYLRPGVRFHNGEPFTAAAVKFSLERYVQPETKYPGFGFIGTIARVDVVDPLTVDVVTGISDGLLLNRLAAWLHIVPPEYYRKVGGQAFSESPVGTGPFKFEKWEKGKRLILAANKDYWMQGFPKINGIIFYFIPTEKQVKSVIAGEVDILTELPGTSTLQIAENPTTKVVKKSTLYTTVIALNFSKGALKSKEIRKALNFAVSRADIIRYDLLANGNEIATVTMPGEEGFDPNLKPYPFDPKKAKEILEKFGYTKENPLILKALVKEQGVRVSGIVKKYLEDVNVLLKVKLTKDSEILKDASSKDWDMFIAACPDPMVHPFFIQSILFYSKSPFTLGKDEYYDSMLEDMMKTLDVTQREEKSRKINQYVYDQAFGIFTYQRIRTFAVNLRVNFQAWITGMPYFYGTEYIENPDKKKKVVQE